MAIDHFKYRYVTFQGSTFPDDPYSAVPVKFNDTIRNEYMPALEKALPSETRGLKLLMLAMTHQEGFKGGTKPTRSYRTNNPGNIGNTDDGRNRVIRTLEDGIKLQAEFIKRIADGKNPNYKPGKIYDYKPYENLEIKRNPQYGLPIWAPGYRFKYTGQLDQFVKIYATGARVTNNYIDTITSLFKASGFTIKPTSTLAEIIALDDKPETIAEAIENITSPVTLQAVADIAESYKAGAGKILHGMNL